MSDIVERLKWELKKQGWTGGRLLTDCLNAIERLRAKNATQQATIARLMENEQWLLNDIATLREALKVHAEEAARMVSAGPAAWTSGKKFDGDLETDDEPHEGWYPLYTSPSITDSMDLAHELMGIAADVDAGNGFDLVCRQTLQRVIDALLAAAPKHGEKE